MRRQSGEPGIELLTELLDLTGVLRHGLLSPPKADGPQESHQGDRAGQQDSALERPLDEARVRLEGCCQKSFAWDEADDEVRRLGELIPVGLLAQRVDVGTQLTGMIGLHLRRRSIVTGRDIVQERGKRHLCVDNDRASTGHQHDHVGTSRAVVAIGGHLLDEVAVLHHAGHLDDPTKLDLAPAPSLLGGPQRGDEALGLETKRLASSIELLDLGQESLVGAGACHLDLGELLLVLGQQRGDRGDLALQALVAKIEVTLEFVGRLFEALRRQVGQAVPTFSDEAARELLEARLERRALCGHALREGSVLGLEPSELDPLAARAPAALRRGDRRPERDADHQGDDHRRYCCRAHGSSSWAATGHLPLAAEYAAGVT